MDHVDAPPELMEQPTSVAGRLHPKTVIHTHGWPGEGFHFEAWLYADNADQMAAAGEALAILAPMFDLRP